MRPSGKRMAKLIKGPLFTTDHDGEAKNASVLIIDESPEVAHVERAVARAAGCVPRIARSAAEAVELLEVDDFDVILLGSPVHLSEDTLLLDLFTRRLRHCARRTVVVTSHLYDGHVTRLAASTNVFAVLAKPFDVSVLADLMWECAHNAGADGPTRWIGVTEPHPHTPEPESPGPSDAQVH